MLSRTKVKMTWRDNRSIKSPEAKEMDYWRRAVGKIYSRNKRKGRMKRGRSRNSCRGTTDKEIQESGLEDYIQIVMNG